MKTTRTTQLAWEAASHKHIREYDALSAEAKRARLLPVEEAVLGEMVRGAEVVHPMSGHGIDDVTLSTPPVLTSADDRALSGQGRCARGAVL